MARLQMLWKQRVPLSATAAAIGILTVVVSELGDVHELRVFGALLISFGGIGLGIDAGLGSRARPRAIQRFLSWRVTLAVTATLLLTFPIVFALVAALIGSVSGSTDRDGLLVATGAVVAASMLGASVVAGVAAARAVAGAQRGEPGIGTDQQPGEPPK